VLTLTSPAMAPTTPSSFIASETYLKRALGDLDRISHWVRIFGMVNSAPGFIQQPSVINGFSDLILELWGTRGRSPCTQRGGYGRVPFGMPAEIEGEVQISA
jgi:hypothetical protein